MQQPPIPSKEEFDQLVLDLCRTLWQDPHAYPAGRNGQGQSGVDIIGQDNRRGVGRVGVQLKWRSLPLGQRAYSDLRRELTVDVTNAKGITPRLAEFVFATTAPRDRPLQKDAERLTEEHKQQQLFSVHVWDWAHIVQLRRSYGLDLPGPPLDRRLRLVLEELGANSALTGQAPALLLQRQQLDQVIPVLAACDTPEATQLRRALCDVQAEADALRVWGAKYGSTQIQNLYQNRYLPAAGVAQQRIQGYLSL